MNAIFFLVHIAILLGSVFAGLFIAAATRGQFDTLDDEARRALNSLSEPR